MAIDIKAFHNKWRGKFSDLEPRVELLRGACQDRWVRFYTLPEGKRYAEEPEERETIINRIYSVLSELTDSQMLIVISTAWSPKPLPGDEDRAQSGGILPKTYWMSFPENPDETNPEFLSYRHLHVQEVDIKDKLLESLFKKVAEDEIAGLILTDSALEWLFCPYDGGMDVIARTANERHALQLRFSEWSE